MTGPPPGICAHPIPFRIKVYDDVLRTGPGPAGEFVDHVAVGEDSLGFAERAEGFDPFGRHLVVKRNDRGPAKEDAEVGDRPLGRVLAVEHDAIHLADPFRRQVGRHIEDAPVCLPVGERDGSTFVQDGECLAVGMRFHGDEEHVADGRPVPLE